jgi:hypothetical protein
VNILDENIPAVQRSQLGDMGESRPVLWTGHQIGVDIERQG